MTSRPSFRARGSALCSAAIRFAVGSRRGTPARKATAVRGGCPRAACDPQQAKAKIDGQRSRTEAGSQLGLLAPGGLPARRRRSHGGPAAPRRRQIVGPAPPLRPHLPLRPGGCLPRRIRGLGCSGLRSIRGWGCSGLVQGRRGASLLVGGVGGRGGRPGFVRKADPSVVPSPDRGRPRLALCDARCAGGAPRALSPRNFPQPQ
jgi:hypothetical protein